MSSDNIFTASERIVTLWEAADAALDRLEPEVVPIKKLRSELRKRTSEQALEIVRSALNAVQIQKFYKVEDVASELGEELISACWTGDKLDVAEMRSLLRQMEGLSLAFATAKDTPPVRARVVGGRRPASG